MAHGPLPHSPEQMSENEATEVTETAEMRTALVVGEKEVAGGGIQSTLAAMLGRATGAEGADFKARLQQQSQDDVACPAEAGEVYPSEKSDAEADCSAYARLERAHAEVRSACDGLRASAAMRRAAEMPLLRAAALLQPSQLPTRADEVLFATAAAVGSAGPKASREFDALVRMWRYGSGSNPIGCTGSDLMSWPICRTGCRSLIPSSWPCSRSTRLTSRSRSRALRAAPRRRQHCWSRACGC